MKITFAGYFRGVDERSFLWGISVKSRTSLNTAFTLREDRPWSARRIFEDVDSTDNPGREVDSGDNPALAKSSTRLTDRFA